MLTLWSGPRMARAGLLAILLALLGTIFLFVSAGPSRRIPPVSISVLPSAEDAALREFSFVQSKDGLEHWKIYARQAQVFEAEAKAILKDVTVTLMGAGGAAMTVQGDEGTINTASKDFVIGNHTKDLAVVLQDGFTVYTSQIAWANQEERLWTDQPVRITGQQVEITGQGMDALLATREMKVRRDVRVEVH